MAFPVVILMHAVPSMMPDMLICQEHLVSFLNFMGISSVVLDFALLFCLCFCTVVFDCVRFVSYLEYPFGPI